MGNKLNLYIYYRDLLKLIRDNELREKEIEESYVIHTPEGESLSPVVMELLKEIPLVCKWR